jgi:hypothetical protein
MLCNILQRIINSYGPNDNSIYKLYMSPAVTLVYRSAYSFTLKTKVTCSSEASVDLQRTTPRYITEDRIIHNLQCTVSVVVTALSYKPESSGFDTR